MFSGISLRASRRYRDPAATRWGVINPDTEVRARRKITRMVSVATARILRRCLDNTGYRVGFTLCNMGGESTR